MNKPPVASSIHIQGSFTDVQGNLNVQNHNEFNLSADRPETGEQNLH